MTQFEQSEWHDAEKAGAYRERADILVQDRPKLFKLLRLFFNHYYHGKKSVRVLDLGCGDGVLGQHLKSCDPQICLSAWDASEDMLNAAIQRLRKWPDVTTRQITFQELIEVRESGSVFDLVVSSMAIHHLSHVEKRGLFAQIHHLLAEDGFFVNIDVAKADLPFYDSFYDEIWRSWCLAESARYQTDEDFSDVPDRVRQKPENRIEPLSVQLQMLESVGFRDVECFYKSGQFVIFGGRK